MRSTLVILCLCTFPGLISHADTIVLKTGKKFQGRVISQDPSSYLFEIDVSDSIKEERRISIDLVDKIIEETPDEKAFKKVTPLVPTPDFLPEASYQQRIGIIQNFITKFPNSAHKQAAKDILGTLEKEHETVAAGGIKQDGKLISRSDLEANAYEIHAQMLLRDIKKLTSARHYLAALRKWDTMQKDYRSASSFKKAIPAARLATRYYRRQLKQLMDTLDDRIKERESALRNMNENDLQRTQVVLEDAKKKYSKLLEKEKELKLKWLTIDPLDKASIEQSFRLTETELDILAKLNATEIIPAGPTYRNAWTSLAENNIEEAAEHVKELQSMKLPERYLQPLEDQLTEKQETQKAAKEKAEQEAAAEKARQEKLAREAAKKAAAENAPKNRRKKRK